MCQRAPDEFCQKDTTMKRLGITGNTRKRKTISACKALLEWLKSFPVDVIIDEELSNALKSSGIDTSSYSANLLQSDAIVVFGGDGTILSIARRVSGKKIPVLAINTGNLGFLSQVSEKELKPMVSGIINDDFAYENRMMLSVNLIRNGDAIFKANCLNDAVITKEALSRIINLSASIDGVYTLNYRADGVIVSTPTGSTAHCLSAGGPIVHPSLNAMIMLPICPHTLSNRPLVIPGKSVIEIEVIKRREREGMILTIDGQQVHDLEGNDRVRITKSPKSFHLIVKPGKDYYSLLRTKLRWGGNL